MSTLSLETPDTTHESLEEAADHFTAEQQLQNTQIDRFGQLDTTTIGNFREAISELSQISPDDPNFAEALHTLQELRSLLTQHVHSVEPDSILSSIEVELDQVQIEREQAEERAEQLEELQQFVLELGSPVLLRNVSIRGLGLEEYSFDGAWSFEEIESQDQQGNVSGKALFTGSIRYPDGGAPTHCMNLGFEIESAKIALGKLSLTSGTVPGQS